MRPSRNAIRAELVAAARAGDEAAQRRLFVQVQSFVSFVLLCLAGRAPGLGELSNDICARVFLKLPRYREKGSFTSWVGKLASRQFCRWQRQEERRQRFKAELRALSGPRIECPEDVAAQRELLAGALDAAQELPSRMLECLVAVHLAGDTPSEAVESIGGTPRAVANTVYRARMRLHEVLEERGMVDGLRAVSCAGGAGDPGEGEHDEG